MSAQAELNEAATGTRNGILLKRIREGYTWSIAVSAPDGSEAAMMEAARVSKLVDAEFSAAYPRTAA